MQHKIIETSRDSSPSVAILRSTMPILAQTDATFKWKQWDFDHVTVLDESTAASSQNVTGVDNNVCKMLMV